jgi:hypothetical protein
MLIVIGEYGSCRTESIDGGCDLVLLTRCDVIIREFRRCVANHCLLNPADLCGHVRQQVRVSTYNRPTFNFGLVYRWKG